MIRRVLVTLGLVVANASVSRPVISQDQTSVFRSGVQQVAVQVTVTDADGRRITDLIPGDFDVFDDGVQQQVNSFVMTESSGQSVSSGGPGTRQPASVVSNATDADRLAPGAVTAGHQYVMVMDWHGANCHDSATFRKAGLEFIDEVLRPEDELLIRTVLNTEAPYAFVRDRDALRAEVNAFADWVHFRCLPTTQYFTRDGVFGWFGVHDAVRWLSTLPGWRKSVVLVSRGTTALWNSKDYRDYTFGRRMFNDIFRSSLIGGIPVHTLDPSGMHPHAIDGETQRPAPIEGQKRLAELQRVSAHDGSGNQDRQSSMRLLADVTGGVSIVNTNNWQSHYTRIIEHRWPTYILGYAAPTQDYDARYHEITVKVRRPGVKVSATPGYYAFRPGGSTLPAITPPRSLSAAAKAALTRTENRADLSVLVHPSALAVPTRGQLLLRVDVSAGARPFDATQPTELVFTAFDRDGALRALDRQVVKLKASQRDPAPSAITAFGRLAIEPATVGRVMVVVAQGDAAVGSATEPLDPDLGAVLARFSDIVLSASTPEPGLIALADPHLQRTLSAMPTPRRSFDRTERLSAYLEVDLDRKMGVLKSGVVVRTLLVADSGEVRWQQTRTSKELPPGSQLEFVSQIPINTVPAGAYQLYFELHSPDVDLTRRSRAVALTIR